MNLFAQPSIDHLIFVTGILLLLGIASNKFSARLGVPVLFVFLMVGMLAGSEGIGGIEFEDYSLANGIGTVALCVILLDGGIRTSYSSIRSAWKPAGVLATVGVFITAILTGLAASWILELSILQGLLLGSIIGSTDASVVFSVLRGGGVEIRPRLASTLEVESGSNDPMAIFLTIGLVEVLSGQAALGPGLGVLFVQQMFFGATVGLGLGWAGGWLLGRSQLGAAGLYPVMATAFGLLSFGMAAELGGSGFLAVYLTGVVIGNQRPIFHRGILLFHDVMAWMCQILMFIALGLLSFPSRLLEAALPAMLISVVLIFVARPIAVFLCGLPFKYNRRELSFISWVGLKGAVPITLATFPMLAGLPSAAIIFDTVFFVVLVSALVQGWSLPLVAKWLAVDIPRRREPPVTLEISSLRNVDGDIVDYYVDEHCIAKGRKISELALPDGVVIALIVRDEEIIPPQGRSVLNAGDHVVVVLRPASRSMVDQVFSGEPHNRGELPQGIEFPLRGSIQVKDLERFYGITLCEDSGTLASFIRQRLGKAEVKVDAFVRCPPVAFRILELSDGGTIETLGMSIERVPEPENATPEHEPGSDTPSSEDTPSEDDDAAETASDPSHC
ncbi:potassium/proton antiporter [Roseimaritima ulvae]|uniref:K(+)/H(+) antiporter NhaP n=1 Tax=Roseimaritima ulvae TaxID=980254 RepID=A0A5B9QMH5_9BACT|nr:potassium/proton antiporter [Roseimaritima ulvae]QEG39279.1 K(+)/H(+) antiporter NhaP [Roseimaritima ulvae]